MFLYSGKFWCQHNSKQPNLPEKEVFTVDDCSMGFKVCRIRVPYNKIIKKSRSDHRYSDYFLNMAGIGICEIPGASRCSTVHMSLFTSRSEFILPFLFLKCFVPNSQWKEKLRDMVVVETTQLLCGDDRRFRPQTGYRQEKTVWWQQRLAGGAGLSNGNEVWALLAILWIHALLLKEKKVSCLGRRQCDRVFWTQTWPQILLHHPWSSLGSLLNLPDQCLFLPLTENGICPVGFLWRLRDNTWKRRAPSQSLS